MSEERTSGNVFLDAPNNKKLMTVIGVYCGVLANLLVSTSNSTLFPAAAADIGGMEIYGLAQGVSGILGVIAMPIFGFIAARNPAMKRWLCGGSLGIGALVLLVRALAPSMPVIIVANVFWGLVSAGVFAVGFTMIRDVYDRKRAGFYLGLVGTMMSIAMLVGPFLGGLVIDRIGWRVWCWILFAILAAGFAVVVFGGVKVSKEDVADLARKGGKFDFLGSVIIAVFLGCLIIALSMGGSYVKFGTPLNTVLLVISVIAFIVLCLVIKKKGNDAIVPTDALKDRNTMALAAANFLHNFGAIGPALAAGSAAALMAVLGLFLGPVFGKAIAKAGTAKNVMIFGNVFRILVMAGFVFALVPGVPVWVIYILMFLAGVFTSQQQATQSAAPQIMLSKDLRTIGNSVIQLGQNLGAGIGMAVFTLALGIFGAGGMRICMIIALVSWIVLFFITFLLKSPAQEASEE